MTKAEAIKKMFANKNQEQLADIWDEVFLPEISAITGNIEIHPVRLDDLLVKEYGKYEGSLQDFILSRWDEEVLEAVSN